MNATRALTLFFALALLALIFFGLSAPTARAEPPVIVRVTVDGATSGTCGDTWANACGLQYALTNTVATAELWVAAGTYTPTTTNVDPRVATFQLRTGIALYGGFATMTETLRSQRNVTTNVTILSGDIGTPADSSDNAYQVVTGSGAMYTAVLDGFTVTGGKADGSYPYSYGGGMYNIGGSPTLTNVRFINNTASFMGGGMFNGGSYPTLKNVTFSGNSAPFAGAMYNGGSNPTLKNVTFSGNSAVVGGGMYNEYGSNPMLTNVTFSGNSEGGMSNYGGSPTIRNTIFWGNTGSQVYNSSGTPAIYDSVVQGGCPAGSTCTNIIAADPLLGAVGNYGGNTETLPLLPGSSAINAGDDSNCPATDQRNKPRVGTCDIGAFESQGFTLTKTSGDNQSTLPNTAFANPLRVTVSSPYGEPVNGGVVTFTAPASGASAIPVTSTVTIASGAVTRSLTANGIVGSYAVTASTPGATAPAMFSLTNFSPDSYLPLIRR